jgi:Glycosyltransferases involved in cell wall biogenesis
MKIKYSVIIPVYNAEKYLDDCIKSISINNRTDIEIIIVNDGSKDKSKDIIMEWSNRDRRIKVVDKKNEGVSTARNLGIQEATGEWVVFVDADDYILEGFFDIADYAITEFPTCNYFCYGSDKYDTIKCIDLENKREKLILTTLKASDESDSFCNIPHLASAWGKILNKKFLQDNMIIFPNDIVMGEDMLFNIEIQSKINDMVIIPNNYYFYRENLQSASRSINVKIPQRDRAFQEYLKLFSEREHFNEMHNIGCRKSAVGGILVSCSSCFYRYPIKEYKKSKNEFLSFISQPIYKAALLKTKDYRGYNFWQKITIIGAKHKIFLPGYLLKKIMQKLKR